MDRRRQDQDKEVIRLLGKLRDTGPEYPRSLYSKRRAAVLASVAGLSLVGGAVAASLVARIVKLVKAMNVVEQIVLGVEVVAVTGLAAYGVSAAYVYRYELRQLMLPGTAITTPMQSHLVSSPVPGTKQTQAITATPSLTPTVTLTITPFPTWTALVLPTGGQPGPSSPLGPEPSATPTKGLHLGNTRTPKP